MLISTIPFSNCRSITKILGEWWANLDKEEKACYTGLAKQVIKISNLEHFIYIIKHTLIK